MVMALLQVSGLRRKKSRGNCGVARSLWIVRAGRALRARLGISHVSKKFSEVNRVRLVMRGGQVLLLLLLSSLCYGCASLEQLSDMDGGTREDHLSRTDSLLKIASDVEAQGDPSTAIKLYRDAVKSSGNAASANIRLGEACLHGNEIQEAIAAYRAALATEPANNEALLGLGAALVQNGALEEGLADLAKAAPQVGTGTAYNRLGVAQMMVGQFANAEKAFKVARRATPGDLDIATNLALAAALGGDEHRAR